MQTLDPTQPIPIYFQLKTLILEEIARGTYGPGDRLPTEEELCREFGISRTPVHRALAELADDGVILRRRRSGTFVNPHWVPRASEKTEIRVVVTQSRYEEQLREVAPAGVTLNVAEIGYADLRRALTRAVAEGLAPDLAIIDSVWISEFADAGFLLPLDELDPAWIREDFVEDFLPPIVQSLTYRDHVYGVPEETNVAGLWCRNDVLERHGLRAPRSWDELEHVARTVAGDGLHALVMPAGSRADETTTYCFLAVLASNGVALADDAVRLDSGAAVEALRLLGRFVEEGLMPVDVVAYEWDQAPRMLAAGEAAMAVGGSYEAGMLAAETGRSLGEIWDVFSFVPFPAGPRGAPATVTGGMAFGIFRQSALPELTMRVLKEFAATPSLAQRAVNEPTIPPRASAIDLVAPEHQFVAETAELFASAVNRPAIRSYHLVSNQVQSLLESVLTGRLRPAAAVERTAEVIGAITGLEVAHD